MQGRNSYEDELARRRRLRERQTAETEEAEPGGGGDEEMPKFGWRDVLAMVIAAYQILFPILFALIGVMLLAWLLFKWYFKA